MAYSQCIGTGPGRVHGLGRGLMTPSILYKNVHTSLRQGQQLGLIVSYCASHCHCFWPSPVPVQFE